jgi:hypothetical protein
MWLVVGEDDLGTSSRPVAWAYNMSDHRQFVVRSSLVAFARLPAPTATSLVDPSFHPDAYEGKSWRTPDILTSASGAHMHRVPSSLQIP